MFASRVFRFSIVSLALVTAGHAGVARAASTLSDRPLITDTAGGAPIFDQSLPEGTPNGEPTLTFAGGPAPVSPPPIPIAQAITIPGVAILVLTEPASEPPDPTEPPIFLPGPNGEVPVSDVLVSTLPVTGGGTGIPGFISLLSDGDPELQNIIPILASLAPGSVKFLEETGTLQDVTSILNGPRPRVSSGSSSNPTSARRSRERSCS